MRLAISIATSVLLARALDAQTAALTAAPARPEPGSIVRLKLDARPMRSDSIASIRGSMAGEPLHFMMADSGVWHAIGAVPVDAPDSVVASVIIDRVSGICDTLRVHVTPAVLPAPKSQPLAVASRFTRPLDAATQARIARENARARDVGRQAHASPPRWIAPFLRPRESPITSQFGAGRVFNGRVTSRHLGVDFKGDSGAPVHAANNGVVALVDTFFLAGTVVYIDHGAGVVTGYFHLSRPLVTPGDTVARGQLIGLVGATGRVTGAHLHWSARYGALAVDPMDLVELDRTWYSGALSKRGTQ